jgi:uncharacterized membrane protein
MDYIVSSAVLLSLDAVYISATKGFYGSLVNGIQKTKMQVKTFAVIATYVMLLFGYYALIISKRRTPQEAAILGVTIYGVFELTNYAIFKNWSIFAVIMDTLWGGFLLYLTTVITYFFIK